jgi:hypothetical protein
VSLLEGISEASLQDGDGVRVNFQVGPEARLQNFVSFAGGSFRVLHLDGIVFAWLRYVQKLLGKVL